MKKLFLLLAVLVALSLILCACGEKPEEEQNSENTVVENNEEEYYEEVEKTIDPADLDKLVVELNGATVRMGDKFADVKGSFGNEIRPANTYTPCGGKDDEKVTTHYYDGLEIEETHEGIVYHAKISAFDFPTSQATICGIKISDSPDTVRNTFGTTPDTDSEYVINYTFGTIAVSYGLDFEESGNVNYISIDDFSIGGV